jgi:hypothetical protein
VLVRPGLAWSLAALAAAVAACGDPPGWAATAIRPAAAMPVVCASTVHPAGPGPADWPVYGRAADRRGVDPSVLDVKALSPLWGARLDGAVSAQPLVAGGMVIAATEHDTVYAFDAAGGCLAWSTSLGPAFDVTRHGLVCNNITPELGITATPAVDVATGTVYAVAFLDPGHYELDALDLATGGLRWRHPIQLPDSNVLQQLSRPALALANGRVYASFGGRAGDCDRYHGFVIGIRQDGAGPDELFQAGSGLKAAIWAPGGPVLLPGGDLLVAIGNSDQLHVYDGSNAVVRLTPGLTRTDLFAPSDWQHLNQVDFDLGSVGPTLLEGQRVFQVGKEGIGYLLDAGHLGGVGGQLFAARLAGGCYAIGATAYRPPLVYVPCDHSLTAVRVHGDTFEVAWRGPDFRSGSPIVAGLVWDYDFEGGWLWGLDPGSGAVRQRVSVGVGEHFVSLSSSAGRLFVPAGRDLYAFTLRT